MKIGEIVEALIRVRDRNALTEEQDTAVCAACNILDHLPNMMEEEEAKKQVLCAKTTSVRHGRWIVDEESFGLYVRCSECLARFDDTDDWGWCPICGSRMDMQACPRCGQPLTGHPALSRVDNETLICPDCGTREALESMGMSKEGQDTIIEAIHRTLREVKDR